MLTALQVDLTSTGNVSLHQVPVSTGVNQDFMAQLAKQNAAIDALIRNAQVQLHVRMAVWLHITARRQDVIYAVEDVRMDSVMTWVPVTINVMMVSMGPSVPKSAAKHVGTIPVTKQVVNVLTVKLHRLDRCAETKVSLELVNLN